MGWRIKFVVIVHNGSDSAFSSAAYLITERKPNNKVDQDTIRSQLVLAKSTCKRDISYHNEVRSIARAMEAVEILREAWKHFMPPATPFYIAGDCIPATYLFSSKQHTDVESKTSKIASLDLIQRHMTIYPDSSLNFLWLDSKSLYPADRISKPVPDPVQVINSKEWRHGQTGLRGHFGSLKPT